MALKVTLLYWPPKGRAAQGHVALMLTEANESEEGIYLSALTIRSFAKEVKEKRMKNIKFLYKEAYAYDVATLGSRDILKVTLPDAPMDCEYFLRIMYTVLKWSPETNIFEAPHDAVNNNCASLVSAILSGILNYPIPNLGRDKPLTPLRIYNDMGQGGTLLSDLEYATSLLMHDTYKLRRYSKELGKRGHEVAAYVALTLSDEVALKLEEFLYDEHKTIQKWYKVKDEISQLVTGANPVLSQHRGYKRIVGNILMFFLLAGIFWALACLINRVRNCQWLLFSSTKTATAAASMVQHAALLKNIDIPAAQEAQADGKEIKPPTV